MSITWMMKHSKILTGSQSNVYNLDRKIINSIWGTLMNQSNVRMNLTYFAMIFIIGLISAYDNTVSWVYEDVLLDTEQNAIGRWLIRLGGRRGEDVSWFLIAKAIGTIIVILTMFRLVYTKYRVAIIPIFIFQVWLYWYLNFADFLSPIQEKYGLTGNDKWIDYDTFWKVIEVWRTYWGI